MEKQSRSTPEALDNLASRLNEVARRVLSPPIKVILSDWADQNLVLASTSAEPGPWRTDRAPYQREILDTCGDHRVSKVVVMSSAQVGKTSALIALIAHYMANDPSPVMMVQPSKQMAENFSQSKLAPVIECSPTLTTLLASTRKRDGGNKILSKQFPGGALYIVGAQSASSLRALSVRVLLLDEVDAYEANLDGEGDTVKIVEARTATFSNRKIVMVSTPTLKDFSRIEREYAASDQRVFELPCPHCGSYQPLEWGGREYTLGMKWDNETGEIWYECRDCHAAITENHKTQMLLRGVWKITNPAGRYPGFHVSALYSPWCTWRELVDEWHECKGLPDKRRSFVNLKLGLPFEDTTNTLDTSTLVSNVHPYDAQVPTGVGVITVGVDVQKDWLECHVYGWGDGEENWHIARASFDGPTSENQVWDDLGTFLSTSWKTVAGADVFAKVVGIDTGYNTELAMKQVSRLRQRLASRQINVVPLKGLGAGHGAFEWSVKKPGVLRLGRVGTHAIKELLYNRLRSVHEHGPGFHHFPTGTDLNLLEGITSERRTIKYGKATNRPVVIWQVIANRRNEPLDCLVYAYAVLQSLKIGTAMPSLVAEMTSRAASPVTATPQQNTAIMPTNTSPQPFTIKGLGSAQPLIGNNWLRRF